MFHKPVIQQSKSNFSNLLKTLVLCQQPHSDRPPFFTSNIPQHIIPITTSLSANHCVDMRSIAFWKFPFGSELIRDLRMVSLKSYRSRWRLGWHQAVPF